MAPFQGVKQNIQEKLAATMSEVMKAKKVLTSAYHEDLSHGEQSRAAALEVNLNDAFGDEEDVTLPPSGAFSATSQAALGPPQPQEPVSDRLENDAADVNQELSAEVHEDAAAPAANEVQELPAEVNEDAAVSAADEVQEPPAEVSENAAAPAADEVQEPPAEVGENAAVPAADEVQDEELEQDGSPVEADAAAAADAALTAQGQEHDAKLAEALSAREEAPARVENGGAAPPDIESVASDSEASQSEGDEVAAALEKERRKKVATALAPTESNSAEQVDQGSVNVPVEEASTSAGGDQDANDATREDQDANMDLEESLAQLGAVNMHRHQQQHLQHRKQRLQHRQQHFQHRQGQQRLQHQQHFQHRQQRFQHRQQRQQ